MKRSTTIWTIVIIIVIIIIGIIVWTSYQGQGASSSSATGQSATNMPAVMVGPTPTPLATSSQPRGPGGAVVLNEASNATLGSYLVAANGMTLYEYSKDTSGMSNCTGQCATAWPPYTVSTTSALEGGTGVGGSISTIKRPDGSTQVTYNGLPLYFWQGDSNVGDTTGQGVNGFSVVNP